MAQHQLGAVLHDAPHDFFNDRFFISEITIYLTHAQLRQRGDFRHAGAMKAPLPETRARRRASLSPPAAAQHFVKRDLLLQQAQFGGDQRLLRRIQRPLGHQHVQIVIHPLPVTPLRGVKAALIGGGIQDTGG